MNKTEQIIRTIKETYDLPDEKIIKSLVKEFNYSESEARWCLKKYKEKVKIK